MELGAMRITFDTGDDGSFGLPEGDPLPPQDRASTQRTAAKPLLDSLYRTQAPRLLRFFSRRIDRQDAPDLVHESFVRFAGAASSSISEPEQPEAYLNQIATNLLRNRARAAVQRSVARHVCADDVLLPANDALATLEARDMLNRLEAAMARLSPKTREIFMAHRIDGLSYKQIGADTGLSVKGVEWHMSKAIAHIARAVGKR
jgi:RNA polymerase sigma factor (sigma-70 family)